ncbi:hypothetical protein [Fusibacter sp. 3D3]|uniref:hypothetical protein n=1 Tax=Fusibacter sp. 3D3 TaxID=1048380 RepID=UPI000853079D|nr:hypothetical protein [Fusibacter sp. 3D3]GAU80023.1 hypothetical protein F3D3_4689 [Fusibacter sp. 3D3]
MSKNLNGLMLIKILEAQFGYLLYSKGEIKFSTAKKWIDDEKKYGHGKGDQFEAIFASTFSYDKTSNIAYKNMYSDVETERSGNFIHYRKRSTLLSPATSFYLVDNQNCTCNNVKHVISENYFKDFSNENQKINLIDKTWKSTIYIRYIHEFEKRVLKALVNIGIKEKDVIFSKIHYDARIRDVNYITMKQPPAELFLKDCSLQHQNEWRIVINTHDPDILNYLECTPIRVGSISDISKIEYKVSKNDKEVVYIKK